MEPITFDLIDGYKEPATGAVHKSVRMHQLTMKEQLAVTGDARAKELLKSPHTLGSKNAVNSIVAMAELREYYCIVFNLTVESLGSLDRQQLQGLAAFKALSTRDIDRMIRYQNNSEGQLISLSRIVEVLRSVEISEDQRNEILLALEAGLGEAQAATED